MDSYYLKHGKNRYERLKKDGVCVICCGNRDRGNLIVCSKCANIKGKRNRYKERKNNNICVYCYKENDRMPKVLCSKCAPIQQARNEEHQLKNKIDTFNAYGGCHCACCGESNIVMLTIDHIEGDGAKHRKELRKGKGDAGGGGNKTYYWLKRNGYPKGYRVLCFNCNHAIYVLGKCPHKSEKSDIKLTIDINRDVVIQ